MSELDEVNTETDKMEENQEEILAENCDHIIKFIDELTNCDVDKMTENSKQQIGKTMERINKFALWCSKKELGDDTNTEGGPIKREDKEVEEDMLRRIRGKFHKESSEDSDTIPLKARPRYKKDETRSLLNTLVDKIDNKKIPVLGKYEEGSGESLNEYFIKFEKYCRNNIRGGDVFWIDELEGKLNGDTLKAFKALKDINDNYDEFKQKMILWYNDMKDLRKKKAKAQFEKTSYDKTESLYLYSTRLEKIFKRAYPNSKVEKDHVLQEKFLKTIPKSARKQLTNIFFNDKMNGKTSSWSTVQKFARNRDVLIEEIKISSSDEEKSCKEILIDANFVKDTTTSKNDIEVSYDHREKKFYITNPGKFNLKPPAANFSCINYTQQSQMKQNTSRNSPNFYQYAPRQRGPIGGDYRFGINNSNNGNNRFSAPPKRNIKGCYRCGKLGHFANECRAKVPTCFNCWGKGHISKDCRYKYENSPAQTRDQNQYEQDRKFQDQHWGKHKNFYERRGRSSSVPGLAREKQGNNYQNDYKQQRQHHYDAEDQPTQQEQEKTFQSYRKARPTN